MYFIKRNHEIISTPYFYHTVLLLDDVKIIYYRNNLLNISDIDKRISSFRKWLIQFFMDNIPANRRMTKRKLKIITELDIAVLQY